MRRGHTVCTPHVVRTHPDHPIVEVTVGSVANDDEVRAILDATWVLQTETGIADVLVDCREMTHSLSYTEVVEMATHFASMGVMPHWREA